MPTSVLGDTERRLHTLEQEETLEQESLYPTRFLPPAAHSGQALTGSSKHLPCYPSDPALRPWLGRASIPCCTGHASVSQIWQGDSFNRRNVDWCKETVTSYQ